VGGKKGSNASLGKALESTSSVGAGDGRVRFSFKYLDTTHPKFAFKSQGSAYLVVLLDRLRDLSQLTMQELLSSRSKALRCHPIDWDEVSEDSFGIPNEEQIASQPYQFSLSSNAHGRVHGFIIDTLFYIVWLDPNHALYS
jgi:hypothetical protein